MDIPVTGYVLCMNDSGDQHSHKLYITSWDGRQVHGFAGMTTVADGHAHEYAGVTAPAPTGVPHVHGLQTETTFNDGHRQSN